ncbi:MAG TPA: hypothetical protein VIV12_26025 [Streptosporangiaceae bacterium]
MGITLPTIGQSAWGGPLNLAVADVAHTGFNPRDLGYKLWNYDPGDVSTASPGALTSGQVRTIKLPRLTQADTLTGLGFVIGTIATTPTAGQCFVGLYTISGTTATRVAVSADISGNLATTGLIKYPFTGTYSAALGAEMLAAILVNAATPPQLGAKSGVGISSIHNGDLVAASLRVANGPSTQTSLPASIDMTTRAGAAAYTCAAAY